MLKAAVYARYSSSLQKESSIDAQIGLCRRAAAKFDCEVSNDHLYSDSGVSGAVTDRPQYQQLMKAAERHEFGAIIAEAQDRLEDRRGIAVAAEHE